MNKATIHIILFLILMVYPKIEGLAQKIDSIIHVNGNVLTGDFKKMEYGIITWKMQGMGTISVEEPFVSTIISKKQFEIIMKNGLIYYSSFEPSDSTGEVIIKTGSEKVSIKIDDIVEIHPIKRNFWMRFSGRLSLGANYAKSSNLTTLAFSGNMTYRREKSSFNATWNLNLSYQTDSLVTNNSEIDVTWQRLFKNKWSSLLGFGTSQNQQLGIQRRYSLNLGAIKDIANNTWSRFYLAGGISGLKEQSTDTNAPANTDMAGLVRVGYDIYKYTSPKVALQSNLSFLPYLTGDARYRMGLNLNPSVSIFDNNFKVGFNFYYTYDSNPPDSSLSNEDYGIDFQLSYIIN